MGSQSILDPSFAITDFHNERGVSTLAVFCCPSTCDAHDSRRNGPPTITLAERRVIARSDFNVRYATPGQPHQHRKISSNTDTKALHWTCSRSQPRLRQAGSGRRIWSLHTCKATYLVSVDPGGWRRMRMRHAAPLPLALMDPSSK